MHPALRHPRNNRLHLTPLNAEITRVRMPRVERRKTSAPRHPCQARLHLTPLNDEVTGVAAPADESGLMAGDVIRRVGKVQVENLDEARKAIKAEIDAEKTSILLLINRQGRDRFTAVTIK
ncbi:MAG: hypothetical protein EBZ18_06470 [Alphaproteobacteria bacterium]|nr:hypothetical protein [Alphaproteobacteria bacterium]